MQSCFSRQSIRRNLLLNIRNFLSAVTSRSQLWMASVAHRTHLEVFTKCLQSGVLLLLILKLVAKITLVLTCSHSILNSGEGRMIDRFLVASLHAAGRVAEARMRLNEYEQTWSESRLEELMARLFKEKRHADRLINELREAGWKG